MAFRKMEINIEEKGVSAGLSGKCGNYHLQGSSGTMKANLIFFHRLKLLKNFKEQTKTVYLPGEISL